MNLEMVRSMGSNEQVAAAGKPETMPNIGPPDGMKVNLDCPPGQNTMAMVLLASVLIAMALYWLLQAYTHAIILRKAQARRVSWCISAPVSRMVTDSAPVMILCALAACCQGTIATQEARDDYFCDYGLDSDIATCSRGGDYYGLLL